MERNESPWSNPLGALMLGRILFHRGTEVSAGCKKVCASADLETEPSESVPKGSHPKVTGPPMQTSDPLGVLGWVLASVSVLVGFVTIAVATIMDREEADHRRGNSFIPQRTKMFSSPSDPIPRHSPTPIVDDVIHGQESHDTASILQQSALRDHKQTLDGKEVRKALPVEVPRAIPDRAN
jgi:hypothetical protein